MLVSELLSVIKAGKPDKAAGALASIFLVAPEIPADEPTWIQPLARVMVRPRKGDVAMLLKTLEQAKVGELYRVGSDAEALAVRITDDEEAPAMSMQNAKTTLTRPESIFRAQVGTANGNLEKGILDLPSIRSVYDLFYLLVRNPELLKKGIETTKLTAHEVWPVLATSLRYAGTPGPVFFILRQLNVSEVGQVVALVKKASGFDRKLLKPWETYEAAVRAVGSGLPLDGTELPLLEQSLTVRKARRPQVIATVRNLVPRNLMVQDLHDHLVGALERDDTASALDVLIQDKEGRLNNRVPLMRKLLDVALTTLEVDATVKCLTEVSLNGVHTNARRALQTIDYAAFARRDS